jgi:enoyl-CoA hydratase/carnithine racemase
MDLALNGRILIAAIANPPENRLNMAVLTRLSEAIDRMEADEADILVITGTGRSFSKGFDIAALPAYKDRSELRRDVALSNAVFSRVAASPKPVIAAINGACMGGGLELALACHFRLCVEKIRLGLPEIWMNIVPGLGGFHRLAKLVGPAKAMEIVALGDLLTSEDALRLNIVNRVLPKDNFLNGVLSFAQALLAARQEAVREVIRLAACSATMGDEDNIREGMESFIRLTPLLKLPG